MCISGSPHSRPDISTIPVIPGKYRKNTGIQARTWNSGEKLKIPVKSSRFSAVEHLARGCTLASIPGFTCALVLRPKCKKSEVRALSYWSGYERAGQACERACWTTAIKPKNYFSSRMVCGIEQIVIEVCQTKMVSFTARVPAGSQGRRVGWIMAVSFKLYSWGTM